MCIDEDHATRTLTEKSRGLRSRECARQLTDGVFVSIRINRSVFNIAEQLLRYACQGKGSHHAVQGSNEHRSIDTFGRAEPLLPGGVAAGRVFAFRRPLGIFLDAFNRMNQ